MAKARLLASAITLTPALLLAGTPSAQASPVPSSATAATATTTTAATVTTLTQTATPVAAATTKKLTLITQEQSKNYYCAPAAVRAVISTWRKSLPSQNTLAGYMHTKAPNGTSSDWIPIGLNRAISPRLDERYQNFHPNNAGFVWNEVTYNIATKKHALIARVLVGAKPWSHSSNKKGHFMVIYGYTTSGGKKLFWWDPADNSRHTASLSASWTAILKGNKYLTGLPKS